jgi:hypothetical protein
MRIDTAHVNAIDVGCNRRFIADRTGRRSDAANERRSAVHLLGVRQSRNRERQRGGVGDARVQKLSRGEGGKGHWD